MKKYISIFLSICACNILIAQNFTWLRGSNAIAPAGTYGTMGQSSPLNDPGGRHGCARWTDQNGKLWLFGGESGIGTEQWHNDLWKYDPTINEWTWIRGANTINAPAVYGTMGVSSPANDPGAREFSVCWTDAAGKFWLFGGEGMSTTTDGSLADLWKYDPITNEWTWINGFNSIDQNGIYGTQGVAAPINKPGGRIGAAGWADTFGNLWLFGGKGFPASGTTSNYLNDLWKYNISTNQWTWMKGSDQLLQAGIYGTQNVQAPLNVPGGREFAATWITGTGDMYMLGGLGHNTSTIITRLQDLWKYDASSNNWTWAHGTSNGNQLAAYGTLGVPSSTNMPGGIYSPATWTDASGKLWLFGGRGYSENFLGNLNSVLRFDPNNGTWTWFKGPALVNPPGAPGIYGTQGVPHINNIPGGRENHSWWVGNNGDVYIFGGLGHTTNTNNYGNSNDLWKYEQPCSPDSVQTSKTIICSGSQVVLTAFNQYSSTVAWYLHPTSPFSLANGNTYTTAPLTAVSGQSVFTFFAESDGCDLKPRTAVQITVNPLPALTISGPSVACHNTTITFIAAGAGSYTWTSGANSATTAVAALSPSFTTVLLGDLNGCKNSAFKTVSVHPLPIVSAQNLNQLICPGTSATLQAGGALNYSWSSTQTGSSIVISPTITTSYTVSGTDLNGCENTAVISQSVSPCSGIAWFTPNQFKFHFYPNPNTGSFTIEPDSDSEMLCTIFGLQGQNLFTSTLTGKTILKPALPAGIYILTIKNGVSFQTQKLIIE